MSLVFECVFCVFVTIRSKRTWLVDTIYKIIKYERDENFKTALLNLLQQHFNLFFFQSDDRVLPFKEYTTIIWYLHTKKKTSTRNPPRAHAPPSFPSVLRCHSFVRCFVLVLLCFFIALLAILLDTTTFKLQLVREHFYFVFLFLTRVESFYAVLNTVLNLPVDPMLGNSFYYKSQVKQCSVVNGLCLNDFAFLAFSVSLSDCRFWFV